MPTIPPDFWQSERERLLAVLLPHLEDAARHGAASGLEKYPRLVFDPDLHNAQAAAWARQHTDELLAQLGATSEKLVGDALAAWVETSGATIGDLKAKIREDLKVNADRADNIAVTEVTRAYASGEKTAYQAAGIRQWRWQTNHDEIVCPICGPLRERVADIGAPFGKDRKGRDITEPPAHPRCRCWVTPMVGKAERPAPGQVQPNIPVVLAATPVAPAAPRRMTGAEVRAKVDEIEQEIKREIEAFVKERDAAYAKMETIENQMNKLGERYSSLTDEERDEHIALSRERDDALRIARENNKKVVEIKKAGIEKARQPLYVEAPLQLQTDIKITDKRAAQVAREGIAEFMRMVGIDLPTSTPIPVNRTNEDSFFSIVNGSVNMSDDSPTGMVIHEFGHALENKNSEVLRKALEFYDRRTIGEALVQLGPPYEPHEKTREDKFPERYMGKEYKDTAGVRYATEIVSMGMQRMWENPAAFAAADPDYFEFIANLLRGN